MKNQNTVILIDLSSCIEMPEISKSMEEASKKGKVQIIQYVQKEANSLEMPIKFKNNERRSITEVSELWL